MTDTHTEALVTRALHAEMLAIEHDHGGEGSPFEELSPEQLDMLQRLARAAIAALDMEELEHETCDVRLPPATTITAGCSVATLLSALETEGRPRNFPARNDERASKLVEAIKTAIQHAYEEGVEDGTEWAETTKFQGEQEPQWIDSVARIEALKLEALSTNTDIIGKLVECLERIADDDCPRVPDRLRIPGQECCDHGKHLDDQRCSDCIRDFARTTLSEARKAMKGDDRG
jgi:hypothetical protein